MNKGHFFFVKTYYPGDNKSADVTPKDQKDTGNEVSDDDFILLLGILNYGRQDGHNATSFTKNCHGHPDKILCACGKVHPTIDCMSVAWNEVIDCPDVVWNTAIN